MVDALKERPEMVILWAGYPFMRKTMASLEDTNTTPYKMLPPPQNRSSQRKRPGPQPGAVGLVSPPDVPRMMNKMG